MATYCLIDPFRFFSPNTRDFSYQPFGSVRNNRSRIDFFLVSEQLADSIKKCFISDRYCRKSFDHRPIFLQQGKRNTSGRKAVNNRIVKHPLILLTALMAVYETYLSHIATNNFGIVRNIVDNALDKLIIIEDDIREISRYCDSVTPGTGKLSQVLTSWQEILLWLELTFS